MESRLFLQAIVLGIIIIGGTHVGITNPMMAGLTKRVTNLYNQYFASASKKPESYKFYAPRESYSYFSPHFNMYYFVGIDYTTPNTQVNITTDLQSGVRGFIWPLMIDNNFLSIAGTRIKLSDVLTQVASISDSQNEIIIVHLKNVKNHEKRVEALLKNREVESLIFKPGDRLKDIENNAAKIRIENLAKKEGITIWPRLKWNYTHKKLIMITWDSDEPSDYCWKYDDYFTDTVTDTKKLITQRVDSLTPPVPDVTIQHPTVFYSDVLRAELATGLGVTTLLAMLMIYNYFNTCISQTGVPPAVSPGMNVPQSIPSPMGESRDELFYKDVYTKEYKQLHGQAVAQKTEEYMDKLSEQRYGPELNALRQKVATLNAEFDEPRDTYAARLKIMAGMAPSDAEHRTLGARSKVADQALREKKIEFMDAVQPDAREMALKDMSQSLVQQLAEQAAAIAARKVASAVRPIAEKTVAYIQNSFDASYYSQILGYGAMALTALAALGIYTSGTTKNLFTVVKKEDVPANPTGFFLTQPLTSADINTVNTTSNTIFHTASNLNRSNFTVINKFQRSFLMTIADRARRLASLGKE